MLSKISTGFFTKLAKIFPPLQAFYSVSPTYSNINFQTDVEEVQFWISASETKIQDRELSPYQLKDNLSYIQSEVSGISEQLVNLLANGKVIGEKTDSQQVEYLYYRAAVLTTVSNSELTWILDADLKQFQFRLLISIF